MVGTNKFHLSVTPRFISTNALLLDRLTRPDGEPSLQRLRQVKHQYSSPVPAKRQGYNLVFTPALFYLCIRFAQTGRIRNVRQSRSESDRETMFGQPNKGNEYD